MVTVDDATYVAMRDNLYNGDSAAASKAKAQIESSYTDEQYNKFVSGLGNMTQKQATPTEATPVNNQPTETPTPVKQETPVKQPETVGDTTTEIKQEGVLKPLSQDYYNQTGDIAQKQIRDNLNNYRQTNPGLFSTYEDFKKNFSYDARNQEQKNTLDAWYGEYQKGMELGNVPVNDLYTQYKDGQVSLSDLETLKVYNPTKYTELQAQINKGNIIQAYDDDKGDDNKTIQEMAYDMAMQTFKTFMSGDGSSEATQFFKEYRANMQSPEMLELQDKTTELQEQAKNIEDDIFSMQKAVEKEYEGTGATRSKISAIVADRTYELQQQLRTINNEYEKYATQYNNRMQQYQNEFQLQLQEYQVNLQARNQQMSELGFALDLVNFETNEQKQQREWDYRVMQQEYENGNINSKDQQTRYKAALKSVQNLLSQYQGIPMKRSAEQMAQDILTAIDNGSDLGTELTKINQQIQDKPEYKYLYNNTFGGSKGFGNSVTIGGQDYIEYNGQLYTAEDFNKKFGGATSKAKYNVVSDDVLKYYSDGRAGTYGSFMSNPKHADKKYGGQCGKFVNDYLEEIGAGRPFGEEDIKTRESWINREKDSPKIGTVAVFDYNHYIKGKNYGHVAIVISEPDANGDFYVKDSNFGSDGIIQTRKVNVKDASLKGFIDPTIDQNGNKGGAKLTTGVSNSSDGGNNVFTSSISTDGNGMISLGNTQLTTSQFDQYVKDYIDGKLTYSEIDKLGDGALNKVTQRKYELLDQGYEPSTKITDPTKIASMEGNLRKEFDKLTEDANATINWVQKMDDAYANVDNNLNSASQALVIAYNKILDESSVVREGEYARTSDGQSLLNQMSAKAQQIGKGGAGITKSELKSLVDMAHTFSQNAQNYRDKMAQRTKVSIDKYGLTPEAVLPYDVIDMLYNNPETADWGANIPTVGGTYGVGTVSTGGYTMASNWQNFR